MKNLQLQADNSNRNNFSTNKEVTMKLFAILCFFSLTCLAQSPTPIVGSPGDVGIGAFLMEAWSAMRNLQSMGTVTGFIVLINLIINFTKTTYGGKFFHKLSDSTQILFILAMSALVVGLTAISQGVGLGVAIDLVLKSAAGSMFLQEFYARVIKTLFKGPAGGVKAP